MVRLSAVLLLGSLLCAPGLCAAQEAPPSGPTATTGVRPAGPTDPTELEHFLDGVIAAQRESLRIEGATIAVVAQGRLLFAKGYGLADRAAGRRVDPERTLFRVASVSKLFTWTAVMQLVEQGRLDLKADVNTYLAGSPVRVPEAFGRPITLTDLLTHTPGYEDYVIGLFGRDASSMRPLGELLATDPPARVRPPGRLAAYSNYGAALAGYIVERVSGLPFEQYVEERIFKPLQMTHATFRQPLPVALKPDMAVGYKYIQGEHRPQPFEYCPDAPAGALSASATDMARFMLAHLGEGATGDARILEATTARRMHSRLFSHHPAVNGMLHGFYEMNVNGHRIYGHGGATIYFHSDLVLFPEAGMGLFVSYNTPQGLPARKALLQAFLDRYFPGPASTPAAAPGQALETGRVVGSFRSLRNAHTTFTKLQAFTSEVRVSAAGASRLRIAGLSGNPTYWQQVAPLVYRAEEGGRRLAFLEDAAGRITHFALDEAPMVAYERVPPLERAGFHQLLMGITLLVLAAAGIAWPILAWRRRRLPALERPMRWERLGLGLTAASLLGLALLSVAAFADPKEVLFGVPPGVRGMIWLARAAAALTVLSLPFLLRAWWKRRGSLRGRLADTAVALAAIALLASLRFWRLLV